LRKKVVALIVLEKDFDVDRPLKRQLEELLSNIKEIFGTSEVIILEL